MCFHEEDTWRFCGCVLDLFLLPVVCLLGLVLNTLCLLVFSKARTHPLVPALIVLSTCDLLQLLFSLLVLFIPALHDFTEAPFNGALGQIAYLSTGLLSPLLLASNCASIWTITYISIQRHKAILSPLQHMCKPPRPFAPLLLITMLALIFNAPKWAEYEWNWIQISNDSQWFIYHEPSVLAMDPTYRQIFDHLLYPVCVYLFPLLVLTCLNLRILAHISMQRLSIDHKSRLAQERRSVTLLISIVILFFVCHTGGLAYRFVDRTEYEDKDWFVLVKDLINLLFNINSFANPMLYFFFTRQFRDLRVNLLHGHFSPSARVGSLPHIRLHSHDVITAPEDNVRCSLRPRSSTSLLKEHRPDLMTRKISRSSSAEL